MRHADVRISAKYSGSEEGSMNQDRRDAQLWAEEWKIKQRNRRRLIAILAIAVIVGVGVLNHYVSILFSRTTYGSAEEMKAALQGRYETDYAEDIVIDGDTITLTYYNPSHYSLEYAEEYGYSEYDDSVYEDTVEEWDFRSGQIKGGWMDVISVDKEGNLVYYQQTFKKTDDPKPVPIDPSELSLYKKGYSDSEQARSGDDAEYEEGEEAEYSEEAEAPEEEAAAEESRLETEEAAENAGIEAIEGSEGV